LPYFDHVGYVLSPGLGYADLGPDAVQALAALSNCKFLDLKTKHSNLDFLSVHSCGLKYLP
jgi:hypothetical protein